MTSSVRRFVGLRAHEKVAVLLALVAAPIVRTLLRRRGYQAVTELLARRARRPVENLVDATTLSRLAESTMLRLPGAYNCLVRSLVVWWLVGGDRVATVRLGVAPARKGEAPRFHAWVEAEGQPINDRPDVSETYLPLTAAAPAPDRFD